MNDRNTDTSHLIKAFLPSKEELVVLPIMSLLILTVIKLPTLFSKADDATNNELSVLFQTKIQEALSALNDLIGATIPLMIFWMFVGIITYILMYLTLGSYNAFRSDLPVERGMIVPKNYNHNVVLRGSIAHIFIRIVALSLLVVWVSLLFTHVLTYVTDLFLQDFSANPLPALLNSILAVLVLSTWLFVIALLSRCVVLRDRVFTN